VKHRDHLFKISSAAMINDCNATEIQSILACGGAYFFLVPEYRNARQPLIDAMSRRYYRAGIVSFGKNDVLRPRRGALADLVENVHV
jgi:hypothetical protein